MQMLQLQFQTAHPILHKSQGSAFYLFICANVNVDGLAKPVTVHVPLLKNGSINPVIETISPANRLVTGVVSCETVATLALVKEIDRIFKATALNLF